MQRIGPSSERPDVNDESQRPRGDITQLLQDIAGGDQRAGEQLFRLVYDQLHAHANYLMARESPGHTLQPTALVHEASLRMLGSQSLQRIANREHFFAVMAKAMRCVLVDHARRRKALRRGGDSDRVPLDVVLDNLETSSQINLLDLNDALDQLEGISKRHSDIVQLRFFVGLTVHEIAEQLRVSVSTVEREWRLARAWLANALGGLNA